MSLLHELDIKKVEIAIDKKRDTLKRRVVYINKYIDKLLGQQQYQAKRKNLKGFEAGQAKLKELYAERDGIVKQLNKIGKIDKKILARNARKVFTLGKKGKAGLAVGGALAAGGLIKYALSKEKD